MDSHDAGHGRHGTLRTMAQMMLGCCLAFVLFIVLAPFVGAWGIVFIVVGLLGCAVMAVLHRRGPAQVRRWLPGWPRDTGTS